MLFKNPSSCFSSSVFHQNFNKTKKSSFKFDLEVSDMVAEKFTVDLDKPIVFQVGDTPMVGHLGEAYDEWVHQPIVSKEGPRFFGNDILEILTRTKWWVIPLIWLPVVCWLVSKSLETGLPSRNAAIAVAGGVIGWTLMEYSLHRFVFHIKANGYWGCTFHYLIHGCHHKHPMDRLRLVFPPAGTAIILVPLWNLFKLLSPPALASALVGGLLLGYIMYDCTHYYLHHGKPDKEVVSNLKRYHMNHHFKVQYTGFGITSSFWDIVFGTLPAKSGKKTS